MTRRSARVDAVLRQERLVEDRQAVPIGGQALGGRGGGHLPVGGSHAAKFIKRRRNARVRTDEIKIGRHKRRHGAGPVAIDAGDADGAAFGADRRAEEAVLEAGARWVEDFDAEGAGLGGGVDGERVAALVVGELAADDGVMRRVVAAEGDEDAGQSRFAGVAGAVGIEVVVNGAGEGGRALRSSRISRTGRKVRGRMGPLLRWGRMGG